MLKIAIIGAGFSGTMAAVHLLQQNQTPVSISLFNQGGNFNKGVAYDSYSQKHLLNVPAGKMSAFHDSPNHFLEWIMSTDHYSGIESKLISNAFLPRKLYGEYLRDVWGEAIRSKPGQNLITEHENKVVDLKSCISGYKLISENGGEFEADKVILATGNESPGDVRGLDSTSLNESIYFQNPWDESCVSDSDSRLPILILGNGLTMVDTVIGLREKGFRNVIYSLSPNGFNILVHRHPGLEYNAILQDIETAQSLLDLVRITNRHLKKVRTLGISAEPIVNALRSETAKLWMRFSDTEKHLFFRRIRHLWGVARHRLPVQIHDFIQNERLNGHLKLYAGYLTGTTMVHGGVVVKYLNKKSGTYQKLLVTRIINCTGPTTDIEKCSNILLKSMLQGKMIEQDSLKLGINVDPITYEVLCNGKSTSGLHAIGSLLKGVFWESTAVGELRVQAANLSKIILAHHSHSTQLTD
jgi:uncharacterized NAD(P)/FAD-binding protein YdhS